VYQQRTSIQQARVFSCQTAVDGVAPGTTISTTAAFSLYNPTTSGKRLIVLRASVSLLSGTLGAGSILWTANTNLAAAATTGSGTAIVSTADLVGNATAPAGVPLTTATLPVAPKLLRPFCGLTAVAVATAAAPWQVFEDVDGEFMLLPGATISLMGVTAAGTSPLVMIGMTWEEIPA